MEKNKNQTNERRPLPGTPFLKNKVFFRLQSGRFAHRSLSAWVRGMACNQHEVKLIERLLNEFAERVKACMNQAEADELEKLIMGDDE